VREQVEHHPMWLAALPELERRGKADEVLAAVAGTTPGPTRTPPPS